MVAEGDTEYIHRRHRTYAGIKQGLTYSLSERGEPKILFKTLVFQLEHLNRLTQEKFASGQATSTQTSQWFTCVFRIHLEICKLYLTIGELSIYFLFLD